MRINSAKELLAYRKAYELAMRAFRLSQGFPDEERFALSSQLRRASRSVCLNLREAWAKRRYEAHFISKLSDCDGENGETESCLDFALDCGCLSAAEHGDLTALNAEIGRLLGSMMLHPQKWLLSHH